MDAFVKRTPKDDDVPPTGNPNVVSKSMAPRPAKRVKRDEIPDSESEYEDSSYHSVESGQPKITDVENALPPVDSEYALQEYEAIKSSQPDEETGEANNDGTTVKTRPMWMRGRSSIYVDAFNLALDTVLEEESHLFDDKEKEVFRQWKELEYQSQFMLVTYLLFS